MTFSSPKNKHRQMNSINLFSLSTRAIWNILPEFPLRKFLSCHLPDKLQGYPIAVTLTFVKCTISYTGQSKSNLNSSSTTIAINFMNNEKINFINNIKLFIAFLHLRQSRCAISFEHVFECLLWQNYVFLYHLITDTLI